MKSMWNQGDEKLYSIYNKNIIYVYKLPEFAIRFKIVTRAKAH